LVGIGWNWLKMEENHLNLSGRNFMMAAGLGVHISKEHSAGFCCLNIDLTFDPDSISEISNIP